MKNLKINVPEGYEIDKDKSTFDNIVFKKTRELPSSWDELEEVNGYYSNLGSPRNYRKNLFKTREQAEASTALAQLSQLRDVYRQGWVPDWECNNLKSAIIFYFNDIKLIETYNQHNFLSFKDEKTAELFLENFRDLIEKAKPLMS